METTKIKFLNEYLLEIHDESVDFDDSLISLSLYECDICYWRFYGDSERCVGHVSQAQQAPNYCPMCGRKIEDNFAE